MKHIILSISLYGLLSSSALIMAAEGPKASDPKKAVRSKISTRIGDDGRDLLKYLNAPGAKYFFKTTESVYAIGDGFKYQKAEDEFDEFYYLFRTKTTSRIQSGYLLNPSKK